MKMEIEIASGERAQQHVIEIAAKPAQTEGRLAYTLDGKAGELDWAEVEPGVYSLILDGRSVEIRLAAPSGSPRRGFVYHAVAGSAEFRIELRDQRISRGVAGAHSSGPSDITAPMPGRVIKLLAKQGEHLDTNQGILVIEAMKMQNELRAPRPGVLERIYVQEGDGVEAGAKLARLI